MEDSGISRWITPTGKRRARSTATLRTRQTMWDLDIAIFLFAVLIVIIILLFQGVDVKISTPVAIFGLAMVWLVGWRRGRQSYQYFYEEELRHHSVVWKNYYKILEISTGAKPEDITARYSSIIDRYKKAVLSDSSRLTADSLAMVKEAYDVLSDEEGRTEYDQAYWEKANVNFGRVDKSEKSKLLDISLSKTKDIRGTKEEKTGVEREAAKFGVISQRAITITIMALLLVLFGGTSFAIARPEHAVAAPFRGTAVVAMKSSAMATHLIEEIRSVAALYERNIISSSFQSMMVDKDLHNVTPVVVPTNDMNLFPSRENGLFPEYVDKKLSQFKYTVDSHGIVSVDKSTATTDAFLESINQMIARLEGDKS